MTTIRAATVEDLEAIVAMGLRFRAALYAPHITENRERMARLAANLIEQPDGVLFVAETGSRLVGMIGMLIFSHYLSGERVAGELFWWVEPDARGSAGIRLLKAAEAWATAHDAVRIQMIAPNADVGRIYTRLGYQAIETGYQRTV